MQIRDAKLEDLAVILDIYNEVIATSTAIYNDDPLNPGEFAVWFQDRLAAGYPVLVAEENGEILGFSSFGDFRPRPGFRFTVEHSVHLTPAARGKGIGSALVSACSRGRRHWASTPCWVRWMPPMKARSAFTKSWASSRWAYCRRWASSLAAGWTWSTCRNSSMARATARVKHTRY
jgi:GNAT superfamily N-acetyltransferase